MPESQSTLETAGVNAEEQDQQTTPVGDEGGVEELAPITLDPKNLVEDIRRLQRENPDFLKIFNNEVGNAADRQTRRNFEPKISQLERELDNERHQRRKLEILGMSEKDIEEKFAKDPVFAKEYAELVHYTPQTEDDTPQLITMAWEEAVQNAADNGVSKEFIDKVAEKAANGGYEASHWSLSIQKLERDIANEIIRIKSKPSETGPKTNPNIVNGSADITPKGRGTATSFPFKTIKEFKELPTAKQSDYLDSPGGMEYVETLMKKG